MNLPNILELFKIKLFKSDLIIFLLFSLILTLLAERLPIRFYNYKRWLYRERKWENGGRIYDKIFFVKKWKSFVPDISDFLKWRFSKKHIQSVEKNYLERFLMESCKSELTHWLIICSSLLFFIWGGLFAFLKILLIAVILNLPYIMIQRYNRPRLLRMLRKNSCQDYALSPAKA